MRKVIVFTHQQSKFLVFYTLIMSSLIASSASKSRMHLEIAEPKTVLELGTGPNNPRNSEGDFITLKDGRILFAYTHFTGESYLDHASAYITTRYSDDQGKTWSTEDQVIVEQEGLQNVMSVSLLRLQNGEIALFYLKKNSDTDCMPMVRFSDDEGKTWSNPVQCVRDRKVFFNMANNRVIQLQDGRLVFVAEFSGKCCSYYSDDNGRSWKSSQLVPNPDNVRNTEPGLVELQNGDLFMIIRTDTTTQYVSYSKDRGESWTPSGYSNIVSASNSPASIATIPSTNDLVLVWNNNNANTPKLKAKRTPLNIALSKDQGKTWENEKTIEGNPNGSFCYTAIHFLDEDVVLLGYFDWATRGSTVKRLNTSWIYD